MRKVGLYFILATFITSTGFQQKSNLIKVFTKNQVHGLLLTANALKSSNSLVKLTITVNNTDENAMSNMEYKLTFIGSNSKVLLDTVIKIPEVKKQKEEIPEYFYPQSEITGEAFQVPNPAYYDEMMKKQFRINAKNKYVSTVSIAKKNVKAIKVKALSATFGFTTHNAPGY